MSFKDRLEEWWITSEFALTKNQLIAIVTLVAIIAFSWIYYYFREGGGDAPIRVSSSQPKLSKSGNFSANKVMVHVAGAVKKPGVYKVKEQARVIDAVELAGGFVNGADKDSLNLAAKVADAQKILVSFKNAATVQGQSGSSTPEVLNLNTATTEQLDDELPGIGETMAKRIIEFREERGSFSSVEQLKDIEGIGEKKFAKIKEKVTL